MCDDSEFLMGNVIAGIYTASYSIYKGLFPCTCELRGMIHIPK